MGVGSEQVHLKRCIVCRSSSCRNCVEFRKQGSLTSFPVFRQVPGAGFGGVLLVLGVRNEFSGSVVEGVDEDPTSRRLSSAGTGLRGLTGTGVRVNPIDNQTTERATRKYRL